MPAATRTLRVLRFLASQPEPMLARPDHARVRPAAQHGVPPAASHDRGGLRRPPADEHRYGLGRRGVRGGQRLHPPGAAPADRRRLLAELVDRDGQSAHLAVLHGRDVLYVVEERAPGRPPLVTDVGVRLPAHLTASGRAMLAALPAAQVRALYPDARRSSTGTARAAHAERAARAAGRHPAARLRRRGGRGHARAWPASPSPVLDHNAHPVAGLALTFADGDTQELADAVRRTAQALSRRLGGLDR